MRRGPIWLRPESERKVTLDENDRRALIGIHPHASSPSASPMRASRPASNYLRAVFSARIARHRTFSDASPLSLPDATSPGAQLTSSRCGNCHAPYNPHEMTASMWDTQVTMMEVKIQAAGMPALTSDERESIVEYLKRNAGTQ